MLSRTVRRREEAEEHRQAPQNHPRYTLPVRESLHRTVSIYAITTRGTIHVLYGTTPGATTICRVEHECEHEPHPPLILNLSRFWVSLAKDTKLWLSICECGGKSHQASKHNHRLRNLWRYHAAMLFLLVPQRVQKVQTKEARSTAQKAGPRSKSTDKTKKIGKSYCAKSTIQVRQSRSATTSSVVCI